jgi:hypothetical protein
MDKANPCTIVRSQVRTPEDFRVSFATEYGLIVAVLCGTAVLTMFYSPEG